MAGRSFDDLYRRGAPELVEKLRIFRETHPPQTVSSDGVTWEVLAGGLGDEAILFLNGVGAVADSHFVQIAPFEDAYRSITPTIPAIESMRGIADGLADVLSDQGVEKAHVLGASFGGLVAQAFVTHYPSLVGDLILSHTMPPRPSIVPEYERQYNTIRVLPGFSYAWSAVAGGMSLVRKDLPDLAPGEAAFWRANFRELYPRRLTQEMYLARVQAGIDFHTNYHFSVGQPAGWNDRLLIVESARDTAIKPADREALKALYPEAEVFTVEQYGHLGALARVEPAIPAMRRFLAGG